MAGLAVEGQRDKAREAYYNFTIAHVYVIKTNNIVLSSIVAYKSRCRR
jgi:hypothetical protein